jgi:hypothetical protein
VPSAQEAQLDAFLAKYTPEMVREARAARATMQSLLPGAFELVYDNYNALVIGYSPTQRPSDAVVSLAFMPRWVSLCFLQGGPNLPDPSGILEGSGTVARHVKLRAGAGQLDSPAVRNLLGVALERARVPFDATQPGRLIVRSVSAKQRPRRL